MLKVSWRVSTKITWLRTGIMAGPCECDIKCFGFCKLWGITWLADRLLTFHEVFCRMLYTGCWCGYLYVHIYVSFMRLRVLNITICSSI